MCSPGSGSAAADGAVQIRPLPITPVVVVYAARLPGEQPFRSERFDVHAPVLKDHLAYCRGLADLWHEPVTIINVEHDMEVSDKLIADLIDCPEPLCTRPYKCYFEVGRKRQVPLFAQHVFAPKYGHARRDGEHMLNLWAKGVRPIREDDRYADFAAAGFLKLAPEARVRPLEIDGWQGVEACIFQGCSGRYHLHWPEIEHFHK